MPTLDRKRDNPEDMFSPEQNMARNKRWARPGKYNTELTPREEAAFRKWISEGKVPFDPEAEVSDYDMRGFWRALQGGDPRARSAIDPHDKRTHYPDFWKTPYAATFSDQSQWAVPGKTPMWQGDLYMHPNGAVIYDDNQGRWYGER
jgi:hypothetical protein